MFNLLVSGVAGAWEGAHFDMDLDRFNTYSGKQGEIVDVDDPASLSQLNGAPVLAMYELGVEGPNADVVRHGRLKSVARYGKVVSCQIELDEERPYLLREKIVEFQRHLDMDRFEQGRTHWAIKDGELPPALLEAALKALPVPDDEPAQAAVVPETYFDDVAILAEGARVVAVIVGLEAYRPGPNQIEAVAFAQADAQAFQQAVETAFAAHRPEICLLTNEGATYGDLINQIAARAYGLGPADLFIFYYAGHGFHDDSGNRLTVWDTNLINVSGTTIGVEEHILGPLRRSECQRVLAFVDACASRVKPLGRKAVTALDAAEFGKLLKTAAFNAVFLSCRAGEESFPDSDLGHGIWTFYLLRALNGFAPEAIDQRGFITAATLQDYLRQEVPRHVASHPRLQATQTPEAIVAATSTFAIRHVADWQSTPAKAGQPEQAKADATVNAAEAVKVPVPDHARYIGSSTEFFARRFARAFPGARSIAWFDDPADIRMRMMRLLEAPLTFVGASPVWWWRDGNLQIERFLPLSSGHFLMDATELDIRRIAAAPGRGYWQSFVYVETAGLPPSGAYKPNPDRARRSVEDFGYDYEEYGLVDGEHVVTRGELDDGAALLGGELQDIHDRVEVRVRHLTPYNFLIAANGSPINNPAFDRVLEDRLNAILRTGDGVDELAAEVWKLPRVR
ncbi:caspase family protein [Brevundimonas sp. TWP2-3-4b2]|uniref:caspase family protein n=1 Tax=Brevundimonas sp. TWP2-3-4b2 TaxID=2804595 RepID=UPI003CF8F4B5